MEIELVKVEVIDNCGGQTFTFVGKIDGIEYQTETIGCSFECHNAETPDHLQRIVESQISTFENYEKELKNKR